MISDYSGAAYEYLQLNRPIGYVLDDVNEYISGFVVEDIHQLIVAMILRCKMYTKLNEEMKNLEKKPNYMTVPEAFKELGKIEMVRQLDNVYRLDHAVTANQQTILNAFGLDANYIKYYASELSKELKKAE